MVTDPAGGNGPAQGTEHLQEAPEKAGAGEQGRQRVERAGAGHGEIATSHHAQQADLENAFQRGNGGHWSFFSKSVRKASSVARSGFSI